MKLKNSFFFTLREDMKDEESISGNLLVRAGFVRKSSSGVYMYLPLGLRVLHKIETIIREEMDGIDSQEVLMPALLPEDVYIRSGRRDNFGHDMFSLKDRMNRNYVLGPTHEELFAQAANLKINSYKDLPFSLYQFETKYRDEPRPRFGLIRVREFIMKDAYTFDKDEAGMDQSYQAMFDAYVRIFQRLGIETRVVRADTGVMGGLLSEEFQAEANIGEDTLVVCDEANYASNLEVAAVVGKLSNKEQPQPREKVYTPDVRTIEEVASFLHEPAQRFVKTLIYLADGTPVAVLLSGAREVNEVKLRKVLGVSEVELADAKTVLSTTGAPVGFAGPVGLNIPIICDQEISQLTNFITGANELDHHYIHVNFGDFTIAKTADIVNIRPGDPCPINPDYPVRFSRGIEVGNTFKLGEKYAKAMDLYFLDENNNAKPVLMGSYGIGLGRCMAALIEQHHDEAGMIWPQAVAPYQAAIVLIKPDDPQQAGLANELYTLLQASGIDVLLDDRNLRPGVKFNDMDLIGIPWRITIGKKAASGLGELKHRTETESQDLSPKEILTVIQKGAE